MLFSLLLLASASTEATNASRALRRGEGKQHGSTTSDSGATATVAAASPAAPAAAAHPIAEACCWSFDATAKRYQYYPRPPNQACVAPGGPGGLGAAPAEEDFDGFGGFEDPQEDDDDDEPPPTGGWGAQQTPPPMGGMGGMGGSVTPAASTADWGDIGMLGQPGGLSAAAQPSIDYGQLDASAHDDGIDWGILGDGPVAAPSQGQAKSDHTEKTDGHGADDAEDEEDFAVFDGFQEGRAVLGGGDKPGGKKKKRDAGEGLSWDAERGLWKETKPRGAFGSLSSGGWDLRGSATFKSPASLLRIRSQAEKIFNDNVSESLFTSPTMQRFKKQTDDMFASLTAYVPVSIISDTRNFFSSWFG